MEIPKRIPGYRILLVLLGGYGAVWIALEGDLLRVTLLALLVALTILVWAAQRFLGGRTISLLRGLILTTAAGLVMGLLVNMLTLILMAVKTGLHAHGPEFTLAEIEVVVSRTPVWAIGGLLLGLGLGLLLAAFRRGSGARGSESSPNL